MKRLVLCLAAAAVCAASPVLAQGPRPSDRLTLEQRKDDVAARIAGGQASGALTDLQVADLRDQFKGLLNLEDQYRRSGLTPDQRADLQARYDTLSMRIQIDIDPSAYRPAGAATLRVPSAEAQAQ